MPVKGHHPEKDGIPACRLTAKTVIARGTSLTAQSAVVLAGAEASVVHIYEGSESAEDLEVLLEQGHKHTLDR